ncbi:unnamed protein product [Adineta steineri]|uniref:Condensation domain-containing protein n=1 Tax=Adineta steineri TaxID=433720 RepID=A0A814NI98_9BILA|nr:unnamed protein product [Adineta steineri]CAF3737410.1 unnamed protein product [Adineta steineri]
MGDEEWKRLNITKGRTSYSQERIWLDEPIRSTYTVKDENLYDYNYVKVYQIEDGFLSINRFRQSIENVLKRNEIFQTELDYSLDEHGIEQIIKKSNKLNDSFEITKVDVFDQDKINEIIYSEQITKHFDLNKGEIFRCHLLRQSNKDKNRLIKNDFILLIFHHSAIDNYSRFLFLKQITSEYQNEKINSEENENELRFIDYSYYERQLDLTKCEEFWQELFSDYSFKQRINLPYDNKLIFISSGSIYSFQIDKSLTRQIFRYKKKQNINFFRLFLSTFYCYLFKITQDTDFSVLGVTPNRYKSQLTNIIGPFENFIVYRHNLDPHQSFNQFIQTIDEFCTNIKENSFYPYQNLIAYARKFGSNQTPFSQVSLRVDIIDDQWNLDPENNLLLNEINLTNHREFKRETKLCPVDLTLNVKINLEKQTIQFYFEYANKLFEEKTIDTFADRFKKILEHLFDIQSNFDLDEEPIYKLSIILPYEESLINDLKVNDRPELTYR